MITSSPSSCATGSHSTSIARRSFRDLFDSAIPSARPTEGRKSLKGEKDVWSRLGSDSAGALRGQIGLAFAGYTILLLLVTTGTAFPFDPHYIVVAQDGSGNFKSITQAIDALPMFNYERVVIFIKNGTYNEKIRITQDYVTLEGESRDSTIIEYDQLRTDWIANKDPIGPAVINIHSDDVILENLTVENTQPEVGPHAFAVYGTGTRTILENCRVLSKGGDTVSMWDYKTGMYYYSHCDFQGAVDFVCPRGWCFADSCTFYELKRVPSIWHAGGYDINQKFVLKNSSFGGVEGFELGRHHYEAQFYLIDCAFSDNMADVPIFRVTYSDSSKNRPFNWGERDYYFHCSRQGGDYGWFADNLSSAPGNPSAAVINPSWTFDGKWNPVSGEGPAILKKVFHEGYLLLFFSEPVTVIGRPVLESGNGKTFTYDSGAGSDTIRFNCSGSVSEVDLADLRVAGGGEMYGTIASIHKRNVDLNQGR